MGEQETIISKNKSQDFFPFQIFINVVSDPACKVQKKLAKLKCSTFGSYTKIVDELNERLTHIKKRASANSKIQSRQIENQLSFLKGIETYFKETRRSYFDYQSVQFLQKKNMDFLHHSKRTGQLKSIKGLRREMAVYFYPNLIATAIKEANGGGRPYFYQEKLKTSQGVLKVSQLRFFFVDIDGATSLEHVQSKIQNFGLSPDVVVRTSEKSFHLYWSINPIQLGQDEEGHDGSQLDKNKLIYELTLKELIAFFEADRARSNATSLLRVPNTWNIKPQKKRKFLCQYESGSRNLEDALRAPKYEFVGFIDHMCKIAGADLWKKADQLYEEKKPVSPSIKDEGLSTSDEVQQFCEQLENKIDFDFEVGWEDALLKLCSHFKVHRNYFDSNDTIVFRHMWKNRLRPILHFPPSIRESLSGSGLKYSELKRSIEKLGSLPRMIRRARVLRPLIKKSAPHRRPNAEMPGQLAGYSVSEEFMVACGGSVTKDEFDWKNRIYSQLYIKGSRNSSIPYDCFILSKVLGFTIEAARDFLIDKIRRSASQPDVNLRCSNDISNVDAWLRYYYD